MNLFFDKIILIIFCLFAILSSTYSITHLAILSFLISISLSFLHNQYFYTKETITFPSYRFSTSFVYLIYFALCFYKVEFCYFLPLLCYDMIPLKNPVLLGVQCFIMLYSYNKLGFISFVLLCLITSVSIILQFYNERTYYLEKNLKVLRDTTTEYNFKLQQKNKNLLEKQDYEIHVATLKERNRIAREIHDNVGHMLSRSILQVGALIAINKEDFLKEPLLSLKDTLNGAMNSIRTSVHDLHDESIDLQSTIQSLLNDFKSYSVVFDYDIGNNMNRSVKYCFISIIKEALSNITKHSNATQISLTLREHPSMYQLNLKDNGENIIVHKNSGIGLENMNERVAQLNGYLNINTQNGFHIFITIPK